MAMKRAEVEAFGASLRLMLDRVEGGDLSASTAMVYRLEGALVAVDVVLGRRDAIERLLGESGE